MSRHEYLKLKNILKWLVPKLAGIFILILGGIKANGKIPTTVDEWLTIAIGVGITFASNYLKTHDNEPESSK